MSIVATEITSIHGSVQRRIYYRCHDDLGAWHDYGPVMTTDPNWDAEAFKATVAQKVAKMLADAEAERLMGDS